ncbi:hypothetical protein VHEMI07653 [[Torrubiella] hemipterigena]|uniref:F-box domain-containing protein n=1 Tax=[Torrubiella] hemipterigena TaxID=1531966 RepID=A0A0A1T453_9HYPO|nr:hypothetical protein VHEMI07653 [[Torrubiella] hemipterigena]
MAVLYHDPYEQTRTLGNLCLVSRHIQSLAQGLLYHFPRIYSYAGFFRTIDSRPELANCVKVMTWVYREDVSRFLFPRRDIPGTVLTAREDIWYLRALAMQLKLQNTEVLEFAPIFIDYNENDEDMLDLFFKHEIFKAFDNLVTSIMLGLCSRLEFLSINLEDGQEALRLQSLPRKATRFQYLPGLIHQRPEGFPFLHTLVIQNTLHDDPNVLGIGSLSFLWKSLPSLQRLIFFRSSTEQYPGQVSPACNDQVDDAEESLRYLKELRFVRCSRYDYPLPLPAIANLVSKCTALELFTFSPVLVEGGTFPPSQLVDAISTTACTLRQLVINCPILDASAVDATRLVTDLRQFTQLQSLVLDQSVFCHHHHFPDSDASPECLTSMLPANIHTLTINIHYPCNPMVDLVALGASVSNGEFSFLRYLRVQVVFAEPSKDDPLDVTSTSYEQNPALLALGARLSDPEWSLLAYRKEIRQILSKAFETTNVVLDVDCFRGCLYQPVNADDWSPHRVSTRFSKNLIHEEE